MKKKSMSKSMLVNHDGRREVLRMFKAVAPRSPRRSVAHRSLKGAVVSEWMHDGRPLVVPLKCVLL